MADKAAKEATKIESEEEESVPLSFAVAKAIVKHTFVDPEPEHPVVASAYKDVSQKKDHLIASRKDACSIAQLRSGHCKQPAHYADRLDDTKSPLCQKCKEDQPETVRHWLECPATITKRMEHFGKDNVDLGILSTEPERSLAFARATL